MFVCGISLHRKVFACTVMVTRLYTRTMDVDFGALLVLVPEWNDCTTSLITSNKKEIRWADLY